MTRPQDNPFNAQRLSRIRYELRGGSWDALLVRIERLGCRAAIVGPRGTGKTTLLEELAARLTAGGRRPHLVRPGPKGSNVIDALPDDPDERDVVLLDGAGRVGFGSWRAIRRRCRRAGLVITAHRAGRMPVLVRTTGSREVLERIVVDLAGDEAAASVRPRLPEMLDRHGGNMREVLRDLYDVFAREGV